MRRYSSLLLSIFFDQKLYDHIAVCLLLDMSIESVDLLPEYYCIVDIEQIGSILSQRGRE